MVPACLLVVTSFCVSVRVPRHPAHPSVFSHSTQYVMLLRKGLCRSFAVSNRRCQLGRFRGKLGPQRSYLRFHGLPLAVELATLPV
jgi:hypothetical protein